MKKIYLLFIILFYSIFIHAQSIDKKWGLGIGLGAYATINELNPGLISEMYLSRYLSPRFDLVARGNTKLKDFKFTSDEMISTYFNLKLKLSDNLPYFYAGPGYLSNNSNSGLSYSMGFGTKIKVGRANNLYFDAGYISGIKSTVGNYAYNNDMWKATLGLEFGLGKTKDTDLDGVSDRNDKCPDTPTGVAVDVNGCPVDIDGDGVADYMDDCPTVAGLSSLKGCPDTDKDGVADKDDACPNEAGLPSLKGCPDSDGDGIADKDDKCANTPKGYRVDASGCPLDQDKDGVVDAEDDCPTVAGPKTNKGCPVKEPEAKKEITPDQVVILNIKAIPVHFVSGKSYLTDYSKGILDRLIKTLNSDQSYHVNMFGYTDSQGSIEDNIILAQSRVESVIAYLTSKGIDRNRIISQESFGEDNPVATNDTEEGRLKNRRVEFEIFKMKE
jgi:OmpA-OmpF porin, OOP family